MAGMTPETKIKNKILDYLKSLRESGAPIFYERRQAGGASYKKGIPDIYFVWKGIHVEVEVKQAKGELSTMQEKFRDRCLRIGTPYILAMSKEDVEEFIMKFLYRE